MAATPGELKKIAALAKQYLRTKEIAKGELGERRNIAHTAALVSFAFLKQGEAVANAVRAGNVDGVDAALEATSEPIREAITEAAKRSYIAGYVGSIGGAYDEPVVTIHEALSVSIGDYTGLWSFPNPESLYEAVEEASSHIRGINDTTRNAINAIVTKGIEEGLSYAVIARQIMQKFIEFSEPSGRFTNRATLVAVTENRVAYSTAAFDFASYMEACGLSMMKAWLSVNDERRTKGCEDNTLQGWIPLNETFPSSATISTGNLYPPRFPGCRCSLMTRMLWADMLGQVGQRVSEAVKNNAATLAKVADAQVQNSLNVIFGAVDPGAVKRTQAEQGNKSIRKWTTAVTDGTLVLYGNTDGRHKTGQVWEVKGLLELDATSTKGRSAYLVPPGVGRGIWNDAGKFMLPPGTVLRALGRRNARSCFEVVNVTNE